MVSWLELQGLKSVHKKTLQTIWAAAAHVEGHITRELEKYMANLSESITRLTQAVRTEFDQIRAEAQAAADAAKAALEQVGSENVELKNALTEQVSKNENLVQQIDDARGRLDTISGELEGNDPSQGGGPTGPTGGTDPNAPYPDNTLPGQGSAGGEHPDNTLPEGEPYPDQSLPNQPGQAGSARGGRGGRK